MTEIANMTAAQLDDLIAKAAKRRAELNQPFANTPPRPIEAHVNPQWLVSPQEGGELFEIKHPGLGWLAFFIPAAERAALAGFLIQHALIAAVKTDDTASALASTPSTTFH